MVIVLIFNYKLNNDKKKLSNIDELMKQPIICHFKQQSKKENDLSHIRYLENYKSLITITLAELLYKVSWNSSPKLLKQEKIKNLLIDIYKTLYSLMHKSHDIWVKLWYFSKKLFCIRWGNNEIDLYHAGFVFKWISNLKYYKTTLYFNNLFEKIWKGYKEVLAKYRKDGIIDDEAPNLLVKFIKKYEKKTLFKFAKMNKNFTDLETPKMDLEIDKFLKSILIMLNNQILNRKNQNVSNEEDKKEINKNQKIKNKI